MSDKYMNREEFNKYIHNQTVKYQRQYGFEMGTGEHATWNNEADAFKHAYMQADIAIHDNNFKAASLGYWHEFEGKETIPGERNMDLWNNKIGREVVQDMKQESGDSWKYMSEEMKKDMAAEKIVKLMREGELITHPSDPRRFWNMDLERIKEKDKVFYKGEYDTLDEETQERMLRQYSRQFVDNDWKMPEKAELNKRVISGELIYVNEYTKADGTKVSGYYRKRGK